MPPTARKQAEDEGLLLEADADNPDPVNVTTFEEDDDPESLAGDFVDEDGDGIDDREENA